MSSHMCVNRREDGPLPADTGWPKKTQGVFARWPRLAALLRARSEVGHEGVVALHGCAPHAAGGLAHLDVAVHARERRHVARRRACRVEARVPV